MPDVRQWEAFSRLGTKQEGVSSRDTPQRQQVTAIVQLADIEDDPGWITDEKQVDEFRATLQRGKPFAGLLLPSMRYIKVMRPFSRDHQGLHLVFLH